MKNKKKLRILELTNFSAGICGVWQRVKQESIGLEKKGHEIMIFSSNSTKGSEKIANSEENLGKIKIKRFPFKKLGGESFMSWFKEKAEKTALDYSPDLIIAHSYRHLHTIKALKIKNKLEKNGKKCKVFLVTHAPFERGETRNIIEKMFVYFYDLFIGKKIINQFDGVIAVTKWEFPYLLNLGLKRNKIAYIPNGISNEFFKLKKQSKEENKILFLGRVAEIKNLEILIKSLKSINDKNIKIEIVGPSEENYLKKLKDLVKEQKIEERIIFSKPVYNLIEKIKKLDSCRLFVLPSISEGHPQSLVEAMAREKIVIASDIPAAIDIIKSGKNGFLFDSNNELDLAKKINNSLGQNNPLIKINARKSVRVFELNKMINKIDSLF